MKHTPRGFAVHTFTDRNGNKCSLRKSSMATEDCIWLGCDEIGLKRFEPGRGWEEVHVPEDCPNGVTHIANNRMHLTRLQVEKLLPILDRFVATGEIEE